MAKNYSKKTAKAEQRAAARRARGAQLAERQNYAKDNNSFRRKVEAINGRGGIDTYYYRLPNDEKQRGKDYFFVMRKFVCFLMFLFLLVTIAYFVLSYLQFSFLPENLKGYGALFVETEAKVVEEEGDGEGEEGEEEESGENADYFGLYADGEEEEEGEEGDEEGEDGEETAAESPFLATYNALDPVFGAIKYWSNRLLNQEINLGDSPMYDSMIALYETGMTDSIAPYIILVMPLAILIYIIIALVLLIKAFLGMFGKRIFKGFGIGAILMLLCGVVVAFGLLAYLAGVDGALDFGGIVNVLIGVFTGVGGLVGGYGLLAVLGLPLIVLILSMFARKKIPYSIFDTYGE
ncbi:MAG: hypothetical protein IJ735_04810 [Clostridia bacterium]|nr:hypothetical protein [Clostridia bacterium]